METSKNQFIIYSKDNCPQCDKVIHILKDEEDVEIKKLGKDFDSAWFKLYMPSIYTSYPVIKWNDCLYSFQLFNHCYDKVSMTRARWYADAELEEDPEPQRCQSSS